MALKGPRAATAGQPIKTFCLIRVVTITWRRIGTRPVLSKTSSSRLIDRLEEIRATFKFCVSTSYTLKWATSVPAPNTLPETLRKFTEQVCRTESQV